MFLKRAGLAAIATAAVTIATAGVADAGTRLRLDFFSPTYGDYYGEPYFVPAPRYYYYQPRPRLRPRYYAYQPDYQYGPDYQYEPDYYEPEVNPKYAPQQRKKKTTNLPPAKPATKQTKPADKKAAGMSCDKATKIVSDYGFTQVKPTSCTGKVYAFNAQRDGKPFVVKLSSASGELTEVKKQ
jgi:hypothetical protein